MTSRVGRVGMWAAIGLVVVVAAALVFFITQIDFSQRPPADGGWTCTQNEPTAGSVRIGCADGEITRFDWTTRTIGDLPPSATTAGTWVLRFANGRTVRVPARVQADERGSVQVSVNSPRVWKGLQDLTLER